MAQEIPGVYIEESTAFPNSVVKVATAVPAFIGYTEKAARGETGLTNIATRLSSLMEFEQIFGGPPKTACTMTVADGKISCALVASSRFLLYYGLRLFFDNGGAACWIVSIGGYVDADDKPVRKSSRDFETALQRLRQESEPTMIVVPDAVVLEQADYFQVANAVLRHCTDLQSRVAILDVFDGNRKRSNDSEDVISGTLGFRSQVQSDLASYGVAYYPWLNTNIVASAGINFANLDADSRARLHDEVAKELAETYKDKGGTPSPITEHLRTLQAANLTDRTATEIAATHQTLYATSSVYKQAMTSILELVNVMPPGAAMAGVFTRTDNNVGVFRAPANTGIVAAISPTVNISSEDQEDLNAPLDGKAINAIRMFAGRGVLVWGARTLDGNSQECRYIHVRRTLIMLEQSLRSTMEGFAFADNNAVTWRAVETAIENFLNQLWRAGALVGTKLQDAYGVRVGLGSTMTETDILDGSMRVMIMVAIVRPAEFIVIDILQKMRTS